MQVECQLLGHATCYWFELSGGIVQCGECVGAVWVERVRCGKDR